MHADKSGPHLLANLRQYAAAHQTTLRGCWCPGLRCGFETLKSFPPILHKIPLINSLQLNCSYCGRSRGVRPDETSLKHAEGYGLAVAPALLQGNARQRLCASHLPKASGCARIRERHLPCTHLHPSVSSMPDKMLDDAGEVLPCCLAAHLQSQRPATAIQVSKHMAIPSRSLNVEPKGAAVVASGHDLDETDLAQFTSPL